MQVYEAKVHGRLCVCAVFPTGSTEEVRGRTQCLWRQQRGQAAQRSPPVAAQARRELASLRGGVTPTGPHLRLRRPSRGSPVHATAGSGRYHQWQKGAHHLHRSTGHATH